MYAANHVFAKYSGEIVSAINPFSRTTRSLISGRPAPPPNLLDAYIRAIADIHCPNCDAGAKPVSSW